jgi:hypothetical protein
VKILTKKIVLDIPKIKGTRLVDKRDIYVKNFISKTVLYNPVIDLTCNFFDELDILCHSIVLSQFYK